MTITFRNTWGMSALATMVDPLEIQPVAAPIRGRVRPPGSKSITNRALVCAALADGDSTLFGALDSEDTRVMIAGLGLLGIEVELQKSSRHTPYAVTADGTPTRHPAEPAAGCPVPATLPAPKYVRDIEEVVLGLQYGDDAGRDATGQTGTGGRFELAALVMPATVEHIRAISSHGERMPAKSTFFYPKLLSGLVINPLE